MTVTPSTPRTLKVNAAFLKDIKDDNRDLKIVLDRLSMLTATSPQAANHWGELVALFADLRDQLAMHFGLEEAFGYLELALDHEVRLSHIAEALRSQHAELFEMARRLAEHAADASVVAEIVEEEVPELTASQQEVLIRFRSFHFLFNAHEEAELQLILDALEKDLGVGD